MFIATNTTMIARRRCAMCLVGYKHADPLKQNQRPRKDVVGSTKAKGQRSKVEGFHSYLSATNGSTFVARDAGM